MCDGQIEQLRMPRYPWAAALRTAGFAVECGQAIAAKGRHDDILLGALDAHNDWGIVLSWWGASGGDIWALKKLVLARRKELFLFATGLRGFQ